jgi:hypothetical protein
MLRERGFKPIDIVAVERFNQKLGHGQWHKAAEEGNFFLRGFNYLMIFKKQKTPRRGGTGSMGSAVPEL